MLYCNPIGLIMPRPLLQFDQWRHPASIGFGPVGGLGDRPPTDARSGVLTFWTSAGGRVAGIHVQLYIPYSF